jgi:hypothetical protein
VDVLELPDLAAQLADPLALEPRVAPRVLELALLPVGALPQPQLLARGLGLDGREDGRRADGVEPAEESARAGGEHRCEQHEDDGAPDVAEEAEHDQPEGRPHENDRRRQEGIRAADEHACRPHRRVFSTGARPLHLKRRRGGPEQGRLVL